MNIDKDTKELQDLSERFVGVLHTNRPITDKITISYIGEINVRVTRRFNGWEVEAFDTEEQKFRPINDVIADAVLNKRSQEVENFRKMQSDISQRQQLQKPDIAGIEKTGEI